MRRRIAETQTMKLNVPFSFQLFQYYYHEVFNLNVSINRVSHATNADDKRLPKCPSMANQSRDYLEKIQVPIINLPNVPSTLLNISPIGPCYSLQASQWAYRLR